MRERLWEIADQSAGSRVVLLGQQSHVVSEREQPLAQRERLVDSPDQHVGVGQPEAARQKRSLPFRQPIVGRACVVAEQKTVDEQPALDGVDGPSNARVVWRKKAHRGQQQQAGVELFRAVRLHEGSQLAIESALTDLVVNRLTDLAPAIDRSRQIELLDGVDAAIEGHPGHDL